MFSAGQVDIKDCEVPKQFRGDYYSYDKRENFDAIINKDGIITNDIDMGECKDLEIDENSYDADGNYDAKILFFDAYVIYFSALYITRST